MSNSVVLEIVDCMATTGGMVEIQRIQTEHRLKLVEFWGIKEGSRVLEIGCGQGDTTAVLAHAVGKDGFVHGVDIALPNYGAPITVGDAALHLQKSKLGGQIKMEYGIDVLSEEFECPDDPYDAIVFSHCSWYLKSFDELEALLKKAAKWGKRLCFAEWDTRIQRIEQFPHFLAIVIQAQYECYKESSFSNVRTLFTPSDIQRQTLAAGWTIHSERAIYSPKLQDAKWEVGMTIAKYNDEIRKLSDVPSKMKLLIESQIELVKAAQEQHKVLPMSVFAFTAELD